MKNADTIPYNLQQEVDTAGSIGQLRSANQRIPEIVRFAICSGSDVKSVVQLISRINDALTLRLINLLERSEGICLPEETSFLVLGSEGRGEQTLRTDQDNAIVYRDDIPPEKLLNIKRFATRLVDALEEVGVPRCPGNIMASTPQWCHSISEWKILLYQWITIPTPEHILNFGMFQDLRALYGSENPVMQLRDHICSEVQCNALFFPNMARHVIRFPTPFTLLGNIRIEQSGTYKGMVDLKKAGIFAITTGASLLALEAGIIGGNTWNKLNLLGKLGFFSPGDLEIIVHAFDFLVHLRLQQQLQDLSLGCKPTNYVETWQMNDEENDQFRQALKGVNAFLWIFRDHYLLDYAAM
jgi:CBS domain-containing protein